MRIYANYSRRKYMDMIDNILRETGKNEEIESILDRHNASEDDSDPYEGYFVTMSDEDLKAAYEEILKKFQDDDDPELHYQALRKMMNLSEYDQGWLDGYESCMDGSMGGY